MSFVAPSLRCRLSGAWTGAALCLGWSGGAHAISHNPDSPDPPLLVLIVGIIAGAAIVGTVATFMRRRQSSTLRRMRAEMATLSAEREAFRNDVQRQTAEIGLTKDKLASLGRERDQYRNLLNAAPFATWRRDLAGDIIWRNATLAEMLGDEGTHEELASKADRNRPQALVAKARDEEAIAGEERRFVVEGQRRVFQVMETPLLSEDESAGFAIDISDAEELRRELRRHIRANNEVLQHMSTAVGIYDREKRLIFANRAFTQFWGLEEEFVGHQPTLGEVMDRLHQNRKLPEQVEYRQFRRNREAFFSTLLEPFEDLYQLPDERMVRETITRHSFGGLLFMVEDATDRIVLERTLNTLIAVQRATLDNLHEAVAVFGPDGRLNLTNFGYRQMLGITEEVTEKQPHVRELLDRVIDLWEEPGVYTEMRESLIASATEMRAGNGRMELPDGRIVDYAATGLPDARTLFTYIDVTDSLRIERALRERNEALVAADLIKSEFLENMSYELRTPLNTILGFAEILHNDYFGTLNERQREYSSGILEASGQFLSMINDMLDLASIQAGHLHVDMEPFRIADAIDSVLEKYRDRAQRRQIRLRVDIAQALSEMVSDQRRVEQILGNLISNAVKFTPPGGEVVITASKVEDTVELSVEDNGIGIPEEEQERVFETFRTSDRHTRRGAGLGLALVRSLMELMGGSVVLRSESGVGTRVSCRFIAIDAEFDQDFEDVPTPALSGMVVPVSGPADKPEA
ncbi:MULTISPECIES: PAS domain-containing sensor histidine kinase [unclassified Minwuia]|uniref:sensor histidine kinase n=1 Tax=unclassified Minwuia TaxID=2618799 RepID=UPI0024792BA3|nr:MULTISPECIES: PAS domain-containing sensor histidine kinase [unclassified Minwuia]